MYELAQKFLNKRCLIYTYNGQITGTITEITPGAIQITSNKTNEIINFEDIMRIREYPTKKNGKDKSVILD